MAWIAQPLIRSGELDDGWVDVYCPVVGDTAEEAKAGAEHILYALAAGKRAVIRCAPNVLDDLDFDTARITHRGFVKFSYRNEPGDWQYPDRGADGDSIAMTAFGLAP